MCVSIEQKQYTRLIPYSLWVIGNKLLASKLLIVMIIIYFFSICAYHSQQLIDTLEACLVFWFIKTKLTTQQIFIFS